MHYFQDLDFKSEIGFWKFWAQITKYGYFASKSFNFLALTKFCPQSISKVLISNPTFVFKNLELKSPNIWPKSANFYIVTKFPLSAISHVLISNLTFAVCGS